MGETISWVDRYIIGWFGRPVYYRLVGCIVQSVGLVDRYILGFSGGQRELTHCCIYIRRRSLYISTYCLYIVEGVCIYRRRSLYILYENDAFRMQLQPARVLLSVEILIFI